MQKYYRDINKQCLEITLNKMIEGSDIILDILSERGYKIVTVTEGNGIVTYDGEEYPYITNASSYPVNPTGLNLLLNTDEILSTIENCVPDKDKYFIAMYMPIYLYDVSAQVRFVSIFDVIKIKEKN